MINTFSVCKYECICVYNDVFNNTFLSRENKSHISEMDNVKVKSTLLRAVVSAQYKAFEYSRGFLISTV